MTPTHKTRKPDNTKRAERAKIRAKIAEVGEQREAFLVKARAEQGGDEAAAFDAPIRFALRDQLSSPASASLIVEPVGRNTAPAVAIAAH